jgi:hypothetical protein
LGATLQNEYVGIVHGGVCAETKGIALKVMGSIRNKAKSEAIVLFFDKCNLLSPYSLEEKVLDSFSSIVS